MGRSFRSIRGLTCAALLLLALGAIAQEPKQAVLDVAGMNCSLCPITVKKALQRVPGLIDAQVDLHTRRAVVQYDAEKATPEQFANALSNAGFRTTVVGK